MREQARSLWCRTIARGIDLAARHAKPWVAALVALRDRTMADAASTERLYVDALFAQRRYQEILDRFPRQERRCAEALLRLGREDEAVWGYPEQPSLFRATETDLGRWDDLVRGYPGLIGGPSPDLPLGLRPWVPTGDEVTRLRVLFDSGPAAMPESDHAVLSAIARIHEGQGITPDPQATAWLRDRLLLAAGHLDELLSESDADDLAKRDGWTLRAIADADRNDAVGMEDRLARAEASVDPCDRGLVDQVLIPFLRERSGHRDAFAAACDGVVARAGRRDRGRARWRALLLLGRASDDEFLAQPFTSQARAELLLLHALRADLADDAQAARLYDEYLALPTWQRATRLPDPADALARWHRSALQAR